MILETIAFLPSADFPPSDFTTGSRRKLSSLIPSAPVLCFSDEEIIEALALWAAGCGPSSSLRGLVTVGDALEASAVLTQAQYAQPEDLARVLETTNFAPGFSRLLTAEWGANCDREKGDEPEFSWWEAQQRDFITNLPKALLIGIVLACVLVLVLAVFGGHGFGEGAGK